MLHFFQQTILENRLNLILVLNFYINVLLFKMVRAVKYIYMPRGGVFNVKNCIQPSVASIILLCSYSVNFFWISLTGIQVLRWLLK